MPDRSFKTKGLVLRTRSLGEADRLVTLLTFEEGKFEAVARGARKTKSKLASGIDLFTFGNFNFHRGKTWPIITGQDPIERFNRFREDPELYSYGLYLNDLTDKLISGCENNDAICGLLLASWRELTGGTNRNLLCRAYELKLADLAGYHPHLQSCACCGSPASTSFSPVQGGLLCSECSSADTIKVSEGTLALARHLLKSKVDKLSLLRPLSRQMEELAAINFAFYAHHINLGEIKSLRMLPL